MRSQFHGLASAAPLLAGPAQAQTAPPPPTAQPAPADSADDNDDGEILITGQRARGSVIGDIAPLGRTIPMSFRKLFSLPPSAIRGERDGSQCWGLSSGATSSLSSMLQ